MSPQAPSIDVLIPAYNEEQHISRCLAGVLAQDYPHELVRVWLIDAGSTDTTVRLAEQRAAADGRLEIIGGPRRLNTAEALNLGISQSRGGLIARVDGHSCVERDYLTRAVDAFNSEGGDVACVGGRPEWEGETPFGHAAAIARRSRFGVGASIFAGTKTREFVDTVSCGIYRREPLVSVGLFDPRMDYAEDEELNWRLRRAGFRLLVDTSIHFRYVTRPSWRSNFQQYRKYGEGRARVVAKHPEFLRSYHLVPAAFVLVMSVIAAMCPFVPRARRTLGAGVVAYVFVALTAAAGASSLRNPRLVVRVATCFVALHVGYGVGLLLGMRRSGKNLVNASLRRRYSEYDRSRLPGSRARERSG
jgi:succinoglycan biosynthesis protein ExoA